MRIDDGEIGVKQAICLWILGAFILGIIEGVFCFTTFEILPLSLVTSGLMAYVLFAGVTGTVVSVLFSSPGSNRIRRVHAVLMLFTAILVAFDTAVIFRMTPYLRGKVGQGMGLFLVALAGGAAAFVILRWMSSRIRKPVAFLLASVVSIQLAFLVVRLVNHYTYYQTIFYAPPAGYYNLAILVLFFPFLYVTYRIVRLEPVMRLVSALSSGAGAIVVLTASLLIFLGGKLYLPGAGTAHAGPNVLLIIMDTTRSDHLSCYGHHRETSPNIDRLAAEGLVFDEAIATAPWTLPTHASMLTGLYPSTHGAHWEHMYLDGSLTTAAELLGERGYQTVGFSNNAIVSDATNISQGFDDFYEGWRGADRFPPLFSQIGDLVYRMADRDDDGARITNDMIRGWFERKYDPDRPFFMLINYFEPHLVYDPPVQFRRRFIEDSGVVRKMRDMNIHTLFRLLTKSSSRGLALSSEELHALKTLYDAEIAYLDFRIGELFDYLDERNVRNRTFTILTSDHGENIGEHGFIDHQLNVYEPLLNVPLILWYPPLIERGGRVPGMVQSVDVYPTILEVAGVDGDETGYPVEGKSLLQIASGRDSRDRTLTEYMSPKNQFGKVQRWAEARGEAADFLRFDRRLKSIRTDSLKYIWASDGGDELYSLEKDPAEAVNLVEERTAAVDTLRETLEDWTGSLPDILGETGEVPEMDEETRQLLKALGYIE